MDGDGSARAKQRPAPLNLELPFDLPEWCREVPVRKTFIDYRCPEESPRGGQTVSGLNTAPASLCGSVLSSLEAISSEPCHAGGQRATDVLQDACSAASTEQRSSASSGSPQAKAGQAVAAYRKSQARTSFSLERSEQCDDEDAAEPGKPKEVTSKLHIHSISTDEDCGSSPDEDDEEDVNICPIYMAGAALPSVGSAGHAEGTCRRCCFFPKGRCNNGKDCLFCHFSHERRKSRAKPKKNKKNKKKAAAVADGYQDVSGVGTVEMSAGSHGHAAPISIVLQTAIPEGSQASGQAYGVAVVSVPFCVGAC
mmetsp:Transcript_4793/g.11219  ORF Transcript_4793/g.11219 Transcript_4793/m.11219 type:complete len:310 (+) Transcript_4793:98-1027(+)